MKNLVIVIIFMFSAKVMATEISYVPDEETAIKIAVAIWSPIYGEERIKSKAPYKATLENGLWKVVGSLPKGYKGGVPEIQLRKSDAKVLYVAHGK